jgi:hypothetical protein
MKHIDLCVLYLRYVFDDGDSQLDVGEVIQVLQPCDQVISKYHNKQRHNHKQPG